MPTVPTVNGPQVRDAALPNVRFNTEVSDETLNIGASNQRLNQSVSNASEAVGQYFQIQKQRGDQVAILDADQKLSALETKLLYDKDNGALNKRGKDSFGLPEEVGKAYNQGADEIEAGLANDEQRLAFRRTRNSRWTDVDRSIQKHVAGQSREYDNEVTRSYVSNEQDAAAANFQDMDRVAMSIQRQRMVLQEHAARNGMPEEWVKAQMVDSTSKTHSLVISRYLNSNLPNADTAAKEYYEAVKGTVSGRDQIAIEKSLEEATLRGESQRMTDSIFNKGLDQMQSLEEARSIKDPKLRDETERRVLARFSQDKAAENALREELYTESARIIDNAPGTSESDVRNLISPETWTKLSPEQQKALQNRAGDPANNDKLWLEFLDQGASIGSLGRAEFETKYWSNFDREHRRRAESMWEAAQEGGKGSTANLTASLTFKDRVENTLKTNGIVPVDKPIGKLDKDDALKYTKFETEAARRLEAFEKGDLQGKRKATGSEVQQILDDMMLQRFKTTKNWIFKDKETLAAIATDEEKQKAWQSYDQIPAGDRNSIENLLRSKGKSLSKSNVENMYGAFLTNDKSRMQQILGGK